MIVKSALISCVGRKARRRERARLLNVFCGLIHFDVGRVLCYFYRHAPYRCSSGLEAGARCGCVGVAAVWRIAVPLPRIDVE